ARSGGGGRERRSRRDLARAARAIDEHTERPERQALDRDRRVRGASEPDVAGEHDPLPAGRERDPAGAEAVVDGEGRGGGESPGRAAGECEGGLLEPAGGARRRAPDGGGGRRW